MFGGWDFDCFAVDGELRAVRICFGGDGKPLAGLIGQDKVGFFCIAHPEEFAAEIFDFDFFGACGAVGGG